MIRLSELKLPLDHTPADLEALAGKTLGLAQGDITKLHIFKRSYDARKANLLVVYIVDVTLADAALELAVLDRLHGQAHVGPTPDTAYRLVAQAPANLPLRPVVVGFGPCGIFAALLLALGLGVPMGVYAALKRGRFSSQLLMVISLLGVSLPTFLTRRISLPSSRKSCGSSRWQACSNASWKPRITARCNIPSTSARPISTKK